MFVKSNLQYQNRLKEHLYQFDEQKKPLDSRPHYEQTDSDHKKSLSNK